MIIRHKTLTNTKIGSSKGDIHVDARGHAEVSDEVGKHLLTIPTWGLPLSKPSFPVGKAAVAQKPASKAATNDGPRKTMYLPSLKEFVAEGMDESKYETFIARRRAEAEDLGLEVQIGREEAIALVPTPAPAPSAPVVSQEEAQAAKEEIESDDEEPETPEGGSEVPPDADLASAGAGDGGIDPEEPLTDDEGATLSDGAPAGKVDTEKVKNLVGKARSGRRSARQ